MSSLLGSRSLRRVTAREHLTGEFSFGPTSLAQQQSSHHSRVGDIAEDKSNRPDSTVAF